ncbi:MAG: membrane protein FxsA [Desulfuromonadales bacterium C00003093]|nr:MAG: membrane protein FxsA [Desulfuromonadales bacterium C00003093]
MFIKLLILFTLVPIIELYVLIEAGRQIGVGATVTLIFITGVAGAFLAKSQGLSLINRIQRDLNEGRVPAAEMIDGAMILAGGLLLLTPGFCTDLIGFCLLTPATRNIFKGTLQNWLEKKIQRGEIHIGRF